MNNYKDFKKKLLRDKEIKAEYDKLEPEFAMAEMLIKKRTEKGLTQGELARKLGTKQSAISRLESGRANPSFNFLQKVAAAFDCNLKVGFSG